MHARMELLHKSSPWPWSRSLFMLSCAKGCMVSVQSLLAGRTRRCPAQGFLHCRPELCGLVPGENRADQEARLLAL